MGTLRSRLIAAFVIATALPLAATIWITMSLLERSLGYATTEEIDRLSGTLEATVRQFYQRERDALREDALEARVPAATHALSTRERWPAPVNAFWGSGEAERFVVSGEGGDHLDFMRRRPDGVDVYTRDLGGIRLQDLSTELTRTREVVGSLEALDLRRGFTLTLFLLVAVVWLLSLVPIVFIAARISRPIQQLTAGLTEFAGGRLDLRLERARDDEVGRAIEAFNHMAGQLRRSRERLVYLTQMSSWQTLARKTAHELKNSLTPIRLTVEEMLARQPSADRAFMEQAVQIVVSEIELLERRVRAFSEFSGEPPVNPTALDLNALVEERVALLRPAHPDTMYFLRLDGGTPVAYAGADLVKGILTNVMENAADAAATGGRVLVVTRCEGGQVVAEIHDSGPGIPEDARGTLFEPAITFKKHGMGLGLSIARKNALLSGGDLVLIDGELGGAAFRLTLPAAGTAVGV